MFGKCFKAILLIFSSVHLRSSSSTSLEDNQAINISTPNFHTIASSYFNNERPESLGFFVSGKIRDESERGLPEDWN